MMKTFIFTLLFYIPVAPCFGADSSLTKSTRCLICGMFVAKYPNWVTKVDLADGEAKYFDGVKDMMVFYQNSNHYKVETADIGLVQVKDYYSLKWINGRDAFYVVGSDVYGPMGHEFIPFSSMKAAKNFMQDHAGKEIISFSEITKDRVESMRVGQKMR